MDRPLVSMHRAWCHACRIYLCWREPYRVRLGSLICPRCRRQCPCCLGGDYLLKGDVPALGRVLLRKKPFRR